MFEVAEGFLVQLVGLIPAILCIYLLFDFIGNLLFRR